jgi:hypothetical protein
MPEPLSDPDFTTLDPRFRWMRDYLHGIAPPARLPSRHHVEPPAFGRLLPFINLVDVERDGEDLRFRFRLVGTAQSIVAGREITGKYVEEAVLPEYVYRIRANMALAVARGMPVYDAFAMPHPGREFIQTERVYFPLASDGTTVDMILILNAYPQDPDFNTVKLPSLPRPRQSPPPPL